jgi:hypothetical protein
MTSISLSRIQPDDLSHGLPIKDFALWPVMPHIDRRIGGELTGQSPRMGKAEHEWLDLVGPKCMRQVDHEAFEATDVQAENNLQGF